MDFIEKLRKNSKYQKELPPEHRQLLEEFAFFLLQQQLAYKTIQRKIYMVGKFLAFIRKLSIYDMGSITTDTIKVFLSTASREISRFNKQISIHYLTHYYVSIKNYFGFLYESKRILIDPAEKIPLPKKNDMLPRNVLTREEIEKLLNQPNIKTYRGLMGRAILEILYGCGLRTGEVCNLTLDDLNLKSGTIHIRNGKGSKDRIIPIGEVAKSWVEKYLQLRQSLRPDLRELFLTDRDNKPIRNDYIARLIRNYLKQAEINKKIVAHSIRHTFATHLLEENVSLRHIQALLGHSTLDATQIYTHVTNPNLKKLHSMIHPRENFNLVENKKEG